MKQPDEWESWNERYQKGQTGWDLGGPAPNLQRLVKLNVPAGAKVLVPGCGRGHDAIALAQAGYRVTGLDFAPEAIAAAREGAERAGVSVTWECGDLFAKRPQWNRQFDAWIELTCFCAIDPSQRDAYASQAAGWLQAEGLLTGLIFTNLPAGGPPFTSTEAELRSTFEKDFSTQRLAMSMESVPSRQGKEWEVVLRKR